MKKYRNNYMRGISLALSIICLSSILTGCGEKVIFTSGIGNDEVFTVSEEIGRRYELKTYLLTLQRQYEEQFGEDIWDIEGNEDVFPQRKENALAYLARVKVLQLMAARDEVTLSEEDLTNVQSAATAYYDSLNESETDYLELTQDRVAAMYEEYAIAQKEYQQIVSVVDPEISDEEARTVTVQAITIATYTTDADGNRVEFTDSAREQARQKAEDIVQEIRDGMDNNLGITFDEYVAKYNEVGSGTYTIGTDYEDPLFREAAFNATIGSFGDPVETADGYRIIKGIAGSDEADMDRTKATLLAERQLAAFEEDYNAFLETLDYRLVDSAYAAIDRVTDDAVANDTFFTTYDAYMTVDSAN